MLHPLRSHPYRVAAATLVFAAVLPIGPLRLTPQARQTAPTTAAVTSYTGAGSCTSSNCHGAVWPKTGGKINQNEYAIWLGKDKHAKAYAILLEPRSKQIARNLKIEKPETAAACLDCHATNAETNQRASSFDVSDGVGCESCHGPASAWLGPHTTRGWTHEQSVKTGMLDTKDARQRTEVCLSCHQGNQQKTVDHELIAAGHPALIFELETFTALMPSHWKKENEKTDTLHRWALAQPIALRESMGQLQRAAAKTSESWPDFAEFECSSCHHALSLPSERQDRGYAGPAGLPPWNEARYIVTRHLIGAVSPAAQKELDSRISDLKKSLGNPVKDRTQAVAAMQRIVELANQSIPQIERAAIDPQLAMGLLRSITSDASNIAWAGMRAAEQATMSVDVLYNAIHPGRPDDPANAQIGRLYELLQSQPRYSPDQFASALKKLASLL